MSIRHRQALAKSAPIAASRPARAAVEGCCPRGFGRARRAAALCVALACFVGPTEKSSADPGRTSDEPAAAPARNKHRTPSKRWPARYKGHFEFKDAELLTLVRRISDITGRNVIVGDKTRGKVTILGPTRVTRAQAWRAFLSALQSLDLTVTKVGRFWRVIPIADGKSEPGMIIDTSEGGRAP